MKWLIEHLGIIKRVVAILIQLAGAFAGWLIACIPIADEIAAYPAFVVLGALIMAWVAMNWLPTRQRWVVTYVAIFAGVVLGALFFAFSPHWILESEGKRYFRGELTPFAAKALADRKGLTEALYLERSGRDPAKVWTEASRQHSRMVVVGVYSVAILLFGFGVFAAIERFSQLAAPKSRSPKRLKSTSADPASGS